MRKTERVEEAELRRKAETALGKEGGRRRQRLPQDTSTLLHELETHQVELEIQNEELRCARQELEESHRRYVDLFDFAPLGYFILDRNGAILACNFTGAQLVGLNKYDLINLPFTTLVLKEDWDIFCSHLAEVFSRGVRQIDELRVLRPDQTVAHLQLQSIIIEDGEHKPGSCRTAVLDITERVRVEENLRLSEERYRAAAEELRQDDRRKNQFLATLSHEIRNPLAAIRTSIDILGRVPPGGEQADRAKAVIDRQSGQLAHLVDDLLDVSRITQNKIVLQWEWLELNELLRRVFEDFQTAFEKNGVSLEQDLHESPIFVTADQTRLAQAFGNLLQNAVKFTPRGGRVIVATALDRAAGQAIVRVADTGIGIEPEMIPRLFKPFAQVDTGLDRHNGGLGLGLALVKGLIELHDGEVSVASAGTGQGTEFTIKLPWQEEIVEESKSAAVLPNRYRRILIIEDNADLAESLRELLEMDGHEVTAAGNGPEGLAMARENPPEVLLCDIGLPGMDGFAVARAFREDERLKDVFLVALTGYAQPEDLERVAAAGFDRHLAKPVEVGTLQRMLGGN